MRMISFARPTRKVIDRTKTVSRRLGWIPLKVGTRLRAVERYRGRRREDIRVLGTIEITRVTREPLNAITDEEVAAEGFPEWDREEFIAYFMRSMGCCAAASVTRIEFRYVEESSSSAHPHKLAAEGEER